MATDDPRSDAKSSPRSDWELETLHGRGSIVSGKAFLEVLSLHGVLMVNVEDGHLVQDRASSCGHRMTRGGVSAMTVSKAGRQ